MESQQHHPALLDLPISIFKTRLETMPEGVTTLRRIVSRESNRPVIEAIRAEPDEEKQYAQKQQLRAFTSVSLLRHRKANTSFADKIARQWPMLAGDVDKKENPGIDMVELKQHLSSLPYVLLCAYSVRGGLWFVVRLPDCQTPDTLAAHFRHLQRVFGGQNEDGTFFGLFGVKLDESKGGNPTDLRFVSYDAAPYLNDAATVMMGTYTPPKPRPRPVRQQGFSGPDEGELLTRLVRFTEQAGEGNRHTTLIKAATVAGGLVAAGRLNEQTAICGLETVASEWPSFTKSQKTIRDGIRYGQQKPLYAKTWSNDYSPPARSARPRWARDGQAIYGEPLPELVASQQDWQTVVKLPTVTPLPELVATEPADSYPPEWDEPNAPDAKPTICAVKFHQWQQQHKYFGRHGVASLQPQQPQ